MRYPFAKVLSYSIALLFHLYLAIDVHVGLGLFSTKKDNDRPNLIVIEPIKLKEELINKTPYLPYGVFF